MKATQLPGKISADALRLLTFAQQMMQAARSETARRLFALYVEQERKWLNNQEETVKAQVDQKTCTGCGLCSETCPDVFEIKAGTANVKGTLVPAEAEAACREAMQDCPVEAISIEA